MQMPGAVPTDAVRARREVHERARLEAEAALARRWSTNRPLLAVAMITLGSGSTRPANPGTIDPELQRLAAALQGTSVPTLWCGDAIFLALIEATTVEQALRVAQGLARLVDPEHSSVGVAHAMEVDDPIDLLRLAAWRGEPARHGGGRARAHGAPRLVDHTVMLTPGELARLRRISETRGRPLASLLREALDGLLRTYAAVPEPG